MTTRGSGTAILALVGVLLAGGACSEGRTPGDAAASVLEANALDLWMADDSLAQVADGEPAQPHDSGLPSVVGVLDLARPEEPATLETGVDQARLAADIVPAVADLIRHTPEEMLSSIGFTSAADADGIEIGRPYGAFTLHKGPWLEFMGYWRVPVLVRGESRSIVGVRWDGDKYVFVSLGGADLARLLAEREKTPLVNAALDMGRAGLLRVVGSSGDSYLAYEVLSAEDVLDPQIRAQPLSWYPSLIPGVDGSSGTPPELSLAELDEKLPPE
jgi:hypothetical protein